MHNRWWVTRPKRDLLTVPLCLAVIAHHAQGRVWATPNKETELAIELGLEDAHLKRRGKRRDQTGGGARTYRAWMKSLGLLFMDKEGRLWLTSAGEALAKGDPPLDILKKQVLGYQFPSAYTFKGSTRVADRFRIRPFVFLLQLLLDERLDGYLLESEEVAKIVISYGETNSQKSVDEVVRLIREHRLVGDAMLPDNYVEEFASSRAQNPTLESLFSQHLDIANTMGNWLGYTQLIRREEGRWFIPQEARREAELLVKELCDRPLIEDCDDEEKFQRRYGLKPGQRKDTRNLDPDSASRTSAAIEADRINIVMLELATERLIERIDADLVSEVALRTGSTPSRVEQVLGQKYPNGAVDAFMHSYVRLAFQSRDKAEEFETATAEIFEKIFGFKTRHTGREALRPDIVVSSEQEHYAGIIDNKAYKEGYSLTHSQRNAMRTYIETYDGYRIDENPLEFFCYVVSEYKETINQQLRQVAELTGISGSAITARDVVRLVRSQVKPSHANFLEMFTSNRVIETLNLPA